MDSPPISPACWKLEKGAAGRCPDIISKVREVCLLPAAEQAAMTGAAIPLPACRSLLACHATARIDQCPLGHRVRQPSVRCDLAQASWSIADMLGASEGGRLPRKTRVLCATRYAMLWPRITGFRCRKTGERSCRRGLYVRKACSGTGTCDGKGIFYGRRA